MLFEEQLKPNRKMFDSDPFGYSALAWHKWGMIKTLAGFTVDISKPPTSSELKDPILWLSQAHAMTEAASILINNTPDWHLMPDNLSSICDSQYCAITLMLVGYSLEICLKAMLILQKGVDDYSLEEKKHKHHQLIKLAEFIPNLSEKDKVILNLLTHFITWAGRYPDPGSGREDDSENIFLLSEKFQISAKDLFTLSATILKYTSTITDKSHHSVFEK